MKKLIPGIFLLLASTMASGSPLDCIDYPDGGFECTNWETGRETVCYRDDTAFICETYKDGTPEPDSYVRTDPTEEKGISGLLDKIRRDTK